MNCYRFQQILSDYIEEILSHGERRKADVHLNECPPCRELLEDNRQLISSVKHIPLKRCRSDFNARLQARIAVEKNRPAPVLRTVWRSWTRGISAAAAVVLFMSAGWISYTAYNPRSAVKLPVPQAEQAPAGSFQSPVQSPGVQPMMVRQNTVMDSAESSSQNFENRIQLVNDRE